MRSPRPAGPQEPPLRTVVTTGGRVTRWAPWLVALVTVFAAAALELQRFRTRSTAELVGEATMERLTYDAGFTEMPALSPDGRLLAYTSDRAGRGDLDIWVQQMPGGVPLRLTDDPADDASPDLSPDGSQIVFRSERAGGGVYIVPALGGPARLLVPDGQRPRFSPMGRASRTGRVGFATVLLIGQPSLSSRLPVAPH